MKTLNLKTPGLETPDLPELLAADPDGCGAWSGIEGVDEAPGAVVGLARAVLRFMHDRHVGVTPELALDLASLLSEEEGHCGWRGAKVWAKLFDQVKAAGRDEELPPHWTAAAGGDRTGQREAWPYLITAWALPLALEACRSVGKSIVFANQPAGADECTPEQYAEYGLEMKRCLVSGQDGPEIARLMRLTSFAARGVGSEALIRKTGGCLSGAAIDHIALAHLLELQPRYEAQRPPAQLQRRRRVSLKRRSGQRPRSDGVEGVTMSRRPEDLPDMMMSESLYPAPVRLDRMLNSGYLVRHRPPRRTPPRDLLILGINLLRNSGEGGAIAKLAWFDAVNRFCLELAREGGSRIDLCWCEVDATGRERAVGCALDELSAARPAADSGQPLLPELLLSMGWTPAAAGLIGSSVGSRPMIRMPRSAGANGAQRRAGERRLRLRWLADYVERFSCGAAVPPGHTKRDVSPPGDYARSHLALMLPAPAPDMDGAILDELREIGAVSRSWARRRPATFSVLWVPGDDAAPEVWAKSWRLSVGAPGSAPGAAEIRAPEPPAEAAELAGAIAVSWLDVLMRAIADE
jgi:hypothetical protein